MLIVNSPPELVLVKLFRRLFGIIQPRFLICKTHKYKGGILKSIRFNLKTKLAYSRQRALAPDVCPLQSISIYLLLLGQLTPMFRRAGLAAVAWPAFALAAPAFLAFLCLWPFLAAAAVPADALAVALPAAAELAALSEAAAAVVAFPAAAAVAAPCCTYESIHRKVKNDS